MTHRINQLLLTLTLASLLGITPDSFASGVVAGATFPEQIVQEITLVNQYATQAQQLQQQIALLVNSYKNLATLPMQAWASATGQLQSLVNLIGNAQGLTYAAQNTAALVSAQYGKPGSILPGYDQQLQNWTGNLNSQIAAVLRHYGLQVQGFQTTQQALQQVQSASQSAAGRMQVLQAGNQIAGMLVNQMQDLQQTVMAGNQAELNYLGNQANQAQQDRNQALRFLRGAQGNY
jgi:P-type conjugative transfer protein TrbJ